jgi:hypothetical protein
MQNLLPACDFLPDDGFPGFSKLLKINNLNVGLRLALIPGFEGKRMEPEPKPMLKKLLESHEDPNSTAVREIVEEVKERVLRNLTPQKEHRYFPASPVKSSGV